VVANPFLNMLSKIAKGGDKMDKEFFYCLLDSKIYAILNQIMCEKAYRDIHHETDSLDRRLGPSFPQFTYDAMMLMFGLPSISVKKVMQMCNGLL